MEAPKCSFPDKRILLAEDDELSREILKQMLSICDVNPDIAENGEEVVSMVSKNEYALLILDIHMPKKTGLEATREIRKMKINQPTIIALTASVLPSEVHEIKEAGFDDYVCKPLELNELKKLLVKHFSKGK